MQTSFMAQLLCFKWFNNLINYYLKYNTATDVGPTAIYDSIASKSVDYPSRRIRMERNRSLVESSETSE